ncbi:hypothetical protein VPH35_021088 [Triticum aestivum]
MSSHDEPIQDTPGLTVREEGPSGETAPIMRPTPATTVASDGAGVLESQEAGASMGGWSVPPSLGKDASGSRTPCKRGGGAHPVLTTPEATIGFIAPGATPPLQRAGKAVAFVSPDEEDAPVIIDFAAARRSTAGRLLVGRLLSPYPADPDAIVCDLRGPWRIRGEVTVQRVVSCNVLDAAISSMCRSTT